MPLSQNCTKAYPINFLIVAFMTSLTWGMTGIFVRVLPSSISPLIITLGRLLIALFVTMLIILCVPKIRQSFLLAFKYSISYVLALLLCGYYILATVAFQMAPVAEVALLLSTPPLFILSLRFLLGLKPTKMEMSGALLSIMGIVYIMAPTISLNNAVSTEHLYGNIIAICAAALTAIYAFVYRRLDGKKSIPSPMGVSLLTFLLGSVLIAIVVSFTSRSLGLKQLSTFDFLIFMGLGIFSTAFPTLGFAIASKNLPSIITAIISLFIPLFSGVFAYIFLGENLSVNFFIGCFLVLSGVVLIVKNKQ